MKHYKYKLNMLEPGCRMIKAMGISGLIGFVCYLFRVYSLCFLLIGAALLAGFILWILLIIESHQDKVLNEQALAERRRNGED